MWCGLGEGGKDTYTPLWRRRRKATHIPGRDGEMIDEREFFGIWKIDLFQQLNQFLKTVLGSFVHSKSPSLRCWLVRNIIHMLAVPRAHEWRQSQWDTIGIQWMWLKIAEHQEKRPRFNVISIRTFHVHFPKVFSQATHVCLRFPLQGTHALLTTDGRTQSAQPDYGY